MCSHNQWSLSLCESRRSVRMAAYWQGYGTLGVGNEAGSSLLWGLGLGESSKESTQDTGAASMDVAPAGGSHAHPSAKGGTFVPVFPGQGELPYQARRRVREQEEAQARRDLLQAVKRAVQRLLLLAVQKENTLSSGVHRTPAAGAPAPAPAQLPAANVDTEEQDAVHQLVSAIMGILCHGIKPLRGKSSSHQLTRSGFDEGRAGAAWAMLERIVAQTPSEHTTMACLEHLDALTPASLTHALLRLSVCVCVCVCVCHWACLGVLSGCPVEDRGTTWNRIGMHSTDSRVSVHVYRSAKNRSMSWWKAPMSWPAGRQEGNCMRSGHSCAILSLGLAYLRFLDA